MAMVACRVLSVVLLLGLYSTSSVTGNNSTASDTVNTLYTSYHEKLRNTCYDHLKLRILCDPFFASIMFVHEKKFFFINFMDTKTFEYNF